MYSYHYFIFIHIHSIRTVNKAVTRTQQLSPGLQKKTSNLTIGGVYSAPNSPHAGTKTGITRCSENTYLVQYCTVKGMTDQTNGGLF